MIITLALLIYNPIFIFFADGNNKWIYLFELYMVDAKVVEICVSKMNRRIGDFEIKYIVDAVNKVTMPF